MYEGQGLGALKGFYCKNVHFSGVIFVEQQFLFIMLLYQIDIEPLLN